MRAILQRAWGVMPTSTKAYLRGHRWYEALSRFAYPDRRTNFEDEVRFHRDFFRAQNISPRLIFDIGANCGEKTAVYVALGASVLAVEPTPELVSHLRERFRARTQVKVAGCAVSDSPGAATLWRVNKFGGAMNTINPKNRDLLASGANTRTPDHLSPEFGEVTSIETRTLDILIKEFGRPDYVKIDAEGHDKEIILGLSFPVPLLSFEANLPEFSGESLEAIDRLCELSERARFQVRQAAGFLLPDWVSPNEVKKVIQSDYTYLEVFASM